MFGMSQLMICLKQQFIWLTLLELHVEITGKEIFQITNEQTDVDCR